MLIPNLKSDFQENFKKSQNQKTRFFFRVFRPEICSKSKKFFFSNSPPSNYLEKNSLKKIKNWSKFGLKVRSKCFFGISKVDISIISQYINCYLFPIRKISFWQLLKNSFFVSHLGISWDTNIAETGIFGWDMIGLVVNGALCVED